MPVAIHSALGVSHDSFEPKRLMRLLWEEEEFRSSKGWRDTVRACRDAKHICDQHGIQMVYVYAPSKPHVVLPLVLDQLPAESLHALLSIEEDSLPPPRS